MNRKTYQVLAFFFSFKKKKKVSRTPPDTQLAEDQRARRGGRGAKPAGCPEVTIGEFSLY